MEPAGAVPEGRVAHSEAKPSVESVQVLLDQPNQTQGDDVAQDDGVDDVQVDGEDQLHDDQDDAYVSVGVGGSFGNHPVLEPDVRHHQGQHQVDPHEPHEHVGGAPLRGAVGQSLDYPRYPAEDEELHGEERPVDEVAFAVEQLPQALRGDHEEDGAGEDGVVVEVARGLGAVFAEAHPYPGHGVREFVLELEEPVRDERHDHRGF